MKQSEIIAFISEGCLFEGNITFPCSSRVDGDVRGNINAKGGLIIGETGVVTGEAKAAEVIVYGKVNGNVKSERVELKKGASIVGDIFAKSLIIEDGAIYNGKCVMERGTEEIIGVGGASARTEPMEEAL